MGVCSFSLLFTAQTFSELVPSFPLLYHSVNCGSVQVQRGPIKTTVLRGTKQINLPKRNHSYNMKKNPIRSESPLFGAEVQNFYSGVNTRGGKTIARVIYFKVDIYQCDGKVGGLGKKPVSLTRAECAGFSK